MSRSIPAGTEPGVAEAGTAPADEPLVKVRHRGVLLIAVMMVAICQFLDATIANVALPHMQVSIGASNDSISWVLTSFIMAGAIFMPATGWLSERVGSRNLFIGSTALFLIASAACGAATSLPAMVLFRAIQGMAAAFIGPMTQTIMFDISPPSKQAQVMTQFGMLVTVAPLSGPFLGGFLTEYMSWRWVFYVNLPIGIPALLLLWRLLPSRPTEGRRLDVPGFVWIGLALGSLQLMLDRGQSQDWFDSWEIIIELLLALSFFWIFLMHTRWTSNPLFSRELLRNPNFLVALAMMMVLGVTNVALSAVLPTLYQLIYHYPVMDAGLLMAPRGFGVIIAAQITARYLMRFDFRYLISFGYLLAAWSLWIMTRWSIEMGPDLIVQASFVQGLGLGMLFAPMNIIAFSTIDPRLRPDGSSLMALFRNLGGSFGISFIVAMLARNQQVSHADIAANVTSGSVPGLDLPSLFDRIPGLGSSGFAVINAEVSRQAAMVAYLDNFYAMFWLVLAIVPLPFILKGSRNTDKAIQHMPVE